MAQHSRLDDMLDWPFFDDRHRQLAADLQAWCDAQQSILGHAQPVEAGPHVGAGKSNLRVEVGRWQIVS